MTNACMRWCPADSRTSTTTKAASEAAGGRTKTGNLMARRAPAAIPKAPMTSKTYPLFDLVDAFSHSESGDN
jgi:hypothetical protein